MDPDQRRLLKQLVVEDAVEASVVFSLLMGAWVEQLFNSCEHCRFRLNIFVQNQRGFWRRLHSWGAWRLQIPLRSFYNRRTSDHTTCFFQGNHYHMRLQPHHCIFSKRAFMHNAFEKEKGGLHHAQHFQHMHP
ncbi:hypothetical protein CK203_117819 [Vitis vinifera]|uniref:Uncharacterized protein n=1 Tax=Vitis vinifera TaxID=29760 RepID=A0A438C8Y6_VITVI|nr:hypothetical protein CK203_117819 [Vitis vinifera]